MLKVAITGNIAAGKSQVEAILSKEFPVYDADKIAHKILGNVDRKALGEKVFNDPKARKELEEYVHPKVKAEILKIFDSPLTPSLSRRARESAEIVFISVPLLFEANFDTLFDKILFVAADDDIRLERLMKRNNLTKEQALLRMNAQLAQEEKIKNSDYIIYNNSSMEDLAQQVSVFVGELHCLVHLKDTQSKE